MANNRTALWLLLSLQALFLLSGLIEPPSSLLLTIFRVVVPLMTVAYLG